MRCYHLRFAAIVWIATGGTACTLVPNMTDDISDADSGYLAPSDAKALISEQRDIDEEWRDVYDQVSDSRETDGIEEELLLSSIEKMYVERYGVAGLRASAATLQDRLCARTLAAADAAGQMNPPRVLTAFQKKNVQLCRTYRERSLGTVASGFVKTTASEASPPSSVSASSDTNRGSSQVASSAYGPPEGVDSDRPDKSAPR